MRVDAVWLEKLLTIIIAAIFLTGLPVRAADGDQQAVAKDARVGGDLTRTRFVADLSETVDFRAFLLADPYRVIVDLPEVKFLMPSGSGTEGKGLISAFRFGLFAQGKSRIVIDVVEPVLIDKAFVRAAENGQPARLIIDLVRATPAQFEKQRNSQTILRSMSPGSFQTSMEEMGGQPKKPEISGGAGRKLKPIIMLDPGHGGVDPGAISAGGHYEKNLVFAFCKALRSKLEATGKYRVLMTREEDIFVPLDVRVDRARKEQADLLVSVHADALDLKHPLLGSKPAKDVRGASIYTLSEEASDDLAKLIAARENRSDVLAGVELPGATDDDLASILIDLMHRETKNLSVSFAKQLMHGVKGSLELTASPHRFANFKVLRAQDVPSVLLELGYLSNADDESALTSEKWRTKVSEAIAEAIGVFFAKRIVSAPG